MPSGPAFETRVAYPMGYLYHTPMGITPVNPSGENEATEVIAGPNAGTEDLVRRLKRVEGQVRGLQQMLIAERDCGDVLTQLAAARKALDHVGFLLVTERLVQCMARPNGTSDDGHDLDDIRRLFLRLT